MATVGSLPKQEGFGATARTDTWWAGPLATFLGLLAFVIYATVTGLWGTHFEIRKHPNFTGPAVAPYLSPMYSPLIFDKDSHHAWITADRTRQGYVVAANGGLHFPGTDRRIGKLIRCDVWQIGWFRCLAAPARLEKAVKLTGVFQPGNTRRRARVDEFLSHHGALVPQKLKCSGQHPFDLLHALLV